VAIALLMLFIAGTAQAHEVHVFAVADGNTIRGEAHSHDEEPIRDARVRALNAAGKILGETRTDGQGKFSLTARYRCDHRLVVDVGAGHMAEYTLPADELPESLPVPPTSPAGAHPQPEHSHEHSHNIAAAAVASPDAEHLLDRLDLLNSQVVQLRKQLDGYEHKVRLHDILGGIGYIVGLMGLGAYFLRSRRA
jgi:nickel transport protein